MNWHSLFNDLLMTALAIIFSLAVILTLSASCGGEEWHAVADAVVRIQAGSQGGTGTLVAIDNNHGYIVTCRHVVEPHSQATATWRNGYRATGSVLGYGQAYDTAIIRITPPTNPVLLPVAEEPAPQDATVEVFGYGGQYGIDVRAVQLIHWRSRVRGYKTLGREELITLDPHALSGDSGGPIVYRNQLVGIVSGGQLNSPAGPAIDSHGPYCRPIRNLLRALAPHVLVVGGDAIRREVCPPGTVCPPSPIRQPVPHFPLSPIQKSPTPTSPSLGQLQQQLDQLTSEASDRQKKINDLIEAQRLFQQQLDTLQKTPGPTGPTGPAGPPGSTPIIDYDALRTSLIQQLTSDPQFLAAIRGRDATIDVNQIAAALPPVRVQLLDVDGKLSQEQSQPLGKPIRFQLVPTRK